MTKHCCLTVLAIAHYTNYPRQQKPDAYDETAEQQNQSNMFHATEILCILVSFRCQTSYHTAVVFLRNWWRKILYNWYNNLRCSDSWNNVVGESFVMKCGVCQVWILSLYLFALYVGELITQLRHSSYGFHIGQLFVGCPFLWDIYIAVDKSLKVYFIAYQHCCMVWGLAQSEEPSWESQ